jgi:ribonuclease-3
MDRGSAVLSARTSALSDLEAVEQAVGYQFRDRNLLETALQHSSFAHESESLESNERLEFLGDAVIGLVIGHLLFEAHADWDEGELTRALHSLVDRHAMAELSRRLELGPKLRLGRTERQSQGAEKESILSDAAEAVIGAMYLDGGLSPVADLARRVYADALAPDAARVPRDPKTRLQEWVMARFGIFPNYECIGDSQIEGDGDRFTMQVTIEGRSYGQGRAQNKRQAERAAALDAFSQIELIEQDRKFLESEEA